MYVYIYIYVYNPLEAIKIIDGCWVMGTIAWVSSANVGRFWAKAVRMTIQQNAWGRNWMCFSNESKVSLFNTTLWTTSDAFMPWFSPALLERPDLYICIYIYIKPGMSTLFVNDQLWKKDELCKWPSLKTIWCIFRNPLYWSTNHLAMQLLGFP